MDCTYGKRFYPPLYAILCECDDTSLSDGVVVTIRNDILIAGVNEIELTIRYANGQSFIDVITYEVEDSTPARKK